MVVAFYFRLHLAYFFRPAVAISARPEHHGFGHKKRVPTQPRAKGRINALCNHIKLRMHLWEMHPYFYFLNETPCFNLLDLLTSDLRHIAGDTYKVCFEKVLTFMLRSYFGLKVDKISENPMF